MRGRRDRSKYQTTCTRRSRKQGTCSQIFQCRRPCGEQRRLRRWSKRLKTLPVTRSLMSRGWTDGLKERTHYVPSGSGRSHLQRDIRKKHARKGRALPGVCDDGPAVVLCGCLCSELFCSAACKRIALTARIGGQDVRQVMSPQFGDAVNPTLEESLTEHATS